MHISGVSGDNNYGDIIGSWFGKMTNKPVHGPYSAMAWISDNTIQIAAVFNNYNKSNIEGHIYGPNRVTKKVLKDIFEYCFTQLKVNRFTAMPSRDNKKLLLLLPRLGFKYESTAKKYYGLKRSDDAIVYVLFKEVAIQRGWVKQ